jgi:methylenetetrahydrofolate reductase (NADPH)
VSGNLSFVAKRPSPKHVGEIARLLPMGTHIYLSADPHYPSYLAGEGAKKLIASGFRPVPHVAVRMFADLAALGGFLGTLSAAGADELFIIAGDVDRAAGVLSSSLDLIESDLLHKHGIVEVGVAGYPEGHPLLPREVLEHSLTEKIAAAERAGLKVHIASQFCFGPGTIADWVEKVRGMGLHHLINIGVPGPSPVSTLQRYASACGVAMSGTHLSTLQRYASACGVAMSGTHLCETSDVEGLLWKPDRFLEQLAEEFSKRPPGEVRLNFFAFGGLPNAASWAASHFG